MGCENFLPATWQRLICRALGRSRCRNSDLVNGTNLSPDGCQVLDEGIHHLLGVVRRGGHPEDLLAPRHGRVVDGLHVVPVAADQLVRNLGADRRVANLKDGKDSKG